MIKDILVHLSVGKPRDVAGEFAVSAAEIFDAHVSGLAFVKEPPIGDPFGSLSSSIIDDYISRQRKEADHLIASFERRAQLAGVTFDSRIVDATVADAASRFGCTARHYDLSVVVQAESYDDALEGLAIQGALFGSGRPVLVVPYIQREGLAFGRITVCWDGSRSAARAVADALPILQRAAQVEVVTVDTKERRNELRGVDIAEHLARHKVRVDLKTLVAPDSRTSDVILSHAADNGTDLMVMGGYGHSRLREFVLGGVTRGMLDSMTVPVLMAH